MNIVLIILSFTSFGQQWQIKLDGGYSIPISGYAKVDVSQSISIIDGYPVAEDFDKKGHGAAETGNYYAVSIKRLFSNDKVIASLGWGQVSNSVNTTKISNYYTDFLNDGFYYVFEQNSYTVRYGFFSIGYRHSISSTSLTLEPLIGYSSLRYPDYKMTAYLDATDEFRFEVIPTGPEDDIGTILLGIQSAIDFNLSSRVLLGISMRYLSANFDYTIELVPSGLDSRKDEDTVNFRAFTLGVSLGIIL
ncbi:MAG TPA: hypothetical protein VKZ75_04820 [Cyclobacteriaceae bacterium]|nr:hypothetical protein [Cyclobacteriaceae bacterium]